MNSPTRVAILLYALAIGLVSASFPERQYDCSSVAPASLDELDRVCPAAPNHHDISKEEARKSRIASAQPASALEHYEEDERSQMDALSQLSVVERCTCSILRHTFAWKAMLTHEVDNMYEATRELIGRLLPDDESDKADNWTYEANEMGSYAYFTDSLAELLENDADAEDFSTELMENFARNYFNPQTLNKPYKDGPQGMGLRKLISTTCNSLLNQYDKLSIHLEHLNSLVDNPRYTYQVVSYDESLFKIFIVAKVCNFLRDSDELAL